MGVSQLYENLLSRTDSKFAILNSKFFPWDTYVTESKPQPLSANETEQLLRAAADGNADAVKAFLAAGANVNGSND
ncbi:MAG TPA: hypothetical protein VN952_05810, partial [Chthoniobacterales bacterium]|nr:hypothetical protein [Chthoniobacterales bacterium]